MKQNFSNFDFQKVYNIFNGNIFNVRINRAGNITLDLKDTSLLKGINEFAARSRHTYTFYNNPNGILIRHRCGWYVTPLNKNYKAYHIDKIEWGGELHDVYNVKYSHFENIDDAIVYFIEYLNKYHDIIC